MKRTMIVAGVFLLMFVFTGFSAFADGENGNAYPNGIEGLKCGEVPPPGVYWRMYNYFYKADDLRDDSGDSSPVDLDLSVYANANRVIWVTNYKILGGDFFVSAMLPVVDTDIEITPPGAPWPIVDDDHGGIGDLYIDVADVIWRYDQGQAGVGLGLFAPIGDFDLDRPASPGKGMWTGMATFAGTYWFDVERTWTASVLARYEKHSNQSERDVRYGDDFHFEWGLSKTVSRGIDVGLAGYCQWQVTDDSGDDVTWDKSDNDRVFAAGPEVAVMIPPPVLLLVSLRTIWEFEAKDRTEGNVTVLTLTKIF